DTRVTIEATRENSKADSAWLAFTDLWLADPARVEMLVSSSVKCRVWANGELIYEKPVDRQPSTQPATAQVEIGVRRGLNRVFVELATSNSPADWQMRLRRTSDSIPRESFFKLALDRSGDPERGRKIFDDVEKSLCLKCH